MKPYVVLTKFTYLSAGQKYRGREHPFIIRVRRLKTCTRIEVLWFESRQWTWDDPEHKEVLAMRIAQVKDVCDEASWTQTYQHELLLDFGAHVPRDRLAKAMRRLCEVFNCGPTDEEMQWIRSRRQQREVAEQAEREQKRRERERRRAGATRAWETRRANQRGPSPIVSATTRRIRGC